MTSVCFQFEAHQPFRLRQLGQRPEKRKHLTFEDAFERYFDSGLNRHVFEKVANRCYLPANRALLELIERFKQGPRKFEVSFSVSGVLLEQMMKYDKGVLESFKQLFDTGCVELVDETHYHSLASLFDAEREEFKEQVKLHHEKMRDFFGQVPTVFRNTEFIYNNGIAKTIEKLGYKAIYTEGIERILSGWRSPNYVYKPVNSDIAILLRNYRLSDDIAYRFSAREWNEWPLTAEKYAAWLATTPGDTINLCMDYETFGEHQWNESGIFWFLRALPEKILDHNNLEFSTPSEVLGKYGTMGEIDVFEYNTVSWADMERDTSAWLGNQMQQAVYKEVKLLEKPVKATRNPDLIHIWRLFQTSDHFYYLCTKHWADGDVHHYFAHMKNPYEGFANFMTILMDFKHHVADYLEEHKISVE